jgi:hypothetical protein
VALTESLDLADVPQMNEDALATTPNSQTLAGDPSGQVAVERRSHARYRLSTPITIRTLEGGTAPAITMEISERGLSALIGTDFRVGDKLELEPIGGGKAEAIVRRSAGRLYAFEFLNLSPEQLQMIRDRCKTLPLYNGKIIGV